MSIGSLLPPNWWFNTNITESLTTATLQPHKTYAPRVSNNLLQSRAEHANAPLPQFMIVGLAVDDFLCAILLYMTGVYYQRFKHDQFTTKVCVAGAAICAM